MENPFRATEEHIGKEFYPVDNSYSQDLSTGEIPTINNGAGLAGDIATAAMKVKIVMPSLKIKVPNIWGELVVKDFCIVEAEGRLFLVLNLFTTICPVPEDLIEDY